MTDKVQLKHVLLDVGFLDKPKILAMRARFGDLSALLLIQIMSTLSIATNAEMDVYAAYGLGPKFGISIDQSKEIVHWCVNQNMFTLTEEIISSPRVTKDQENCGKKREEARLRKEAYLLKLKEQEENAVEFANNSIKLYEKNEVGTRSERVLPVTVSVTDPVPVNNIKNCEPPIPRSLELNDFQKDAALQALLANGFKTEELARRLFILQGYYVKNPTKYRPEVVIFDLCSPIVTQMMLDERTSKLNHEAAQVRLGNAKNGYKTTSPPSELSDPQKAKLREMLREKQTELTKLITSGKIDHHRAENDLRSFEKTMKKKILEGAVC